MQVGFLEIDDPRWPAVLADAPHDVYHLPEYVALDARLEDGTPLAFFAEHRGDWLLIPLIIRPIDRRLTGARGPLQDAVSPYGYPAPLTNLPSAPAARGVTFLEAAIEAFVETLRKRGVVSVFIRLHPLLSAPVDVLTRFGRLVRHGDTVFVDLTLADEEIRRQTRRDHRRDIDRAAREGQVGRIDEDWERIDDFVEIYRQTMRRVGADDSYYFPRDYFVALKETLADRCHLSLVEIDGQVASAGVVTEVNGIVQNHLSGTRDEFLKASPEKARTHFLRTWAKQRGNYVFHLGGGLGARQDGLFEFKAGFSKERGAFHTWRVIVDEPAYRALVSRWEAAHGPADGPDGFFPAYRRSPPGGSESPAWARGGQP